MTTKKRLGGYGRTQAAPDLRIVDGERGRLDPEPGKPRQSGDLSGVSGVKAMIADARPVAQRPRLDPEPGEPRNGVDPGEWKPDGLGLPPECPITPLGVSGPVCWFLDAIGQLQALSPPYARGNILALFGGRDLFL